MSGSSETKAYLDEKLRAAQWVIRSIEQRNKTIVKVVTSIVKFQEQFFEKGMQYLRPLVLKQVAEDIGMHESTISRVTANKYMYCPQGMLELKFFFNAGLQRADQPSRHDVVGDGSRDDQENGGGGGCQPSAQRRRNRRAIA